MLSKEAKAIKQVPEGWQCSLSTYRKIFDFASPECLNDYKDWNDYTILDMIKVENRLARRPY